jgi:hypothetical protein
MASLLDIGPSTEQVVINGRAVTVYGVTPEGFLYLASKFPELQNVLREGIDIEAMRSVAPCSIAYALAVTTTSRSYLTRQQWLDVVEVTAQAAMNLGANDQMALFQAALRLTFPDGIGPFIAMVETLTATINRVTGATLGAATEPAANPLN